jgi:DNA-3-methyladenine glycosylase II
MALTTEAQMLAITKKIIKVDPAFKPIIARAPLCTIGRRRPKQGHYETLVDSIISQQLAIKAAETIFNRLKDLVDGEILPDKISQLSVNQLRSVGASGAKAKSIFELTEAALSGELNFTKYSRMSNEEITADLIKIWGIGRWTTEMFLMFHLGRLDVWPVLDLGVRRGWEKIHGLKSEIDPKKLDPIGEKFDGYQSIVAWYCWRALEKEPTQI